MIFQELKSEFLCSYRKLIQENIVASGSSRKKCWPNDKCDQAERILNETWWPSVSPDSTWTGAN